MHFFWFCCASLQCVIKFKYTNGVGFYAFCTLVSIFQSSPFTVHLIVEVTVFHVNVAIANMQPFNQEAYIFFCNTPASLLCIVLIWVPDFQITSKALWLSNTQAPQQTHTGATTQGYSMQENNNNTQQPMQQKDDEKKRKKRKQVKRACQTCRKAHASCDDERPCRRCIQLGMADQCIDSDLVVTPTSSTRKRKLEDTGEGKNGYFL